MDTAESNELIRYARYKLDRLKDLSAITREQQTAIEKEDIDRLNELVALKWQLINDINRCDASIEHKLEQTGLENGITGPAGFGSNNGAGGSSGLLYGILGEIRDQMEVIRAIEEQNHGTLRKAMERAMALLRKIKDGKKGIKGYGRIVNNPYGSFIDKKK